MTLWDKVFDAIERKLELPNPIKQIAKKIGRDLDSNEFIRTYPGTPLDYYPKDRVEEVYAFFIGYAGIPLENYLRSLKNMRLHMKVELDYGGLRDKITKAYDIGRNAAIEDGELKIKDELNLESQIDKALGV